MGFKKVFNPWVGYTTRSYAQIKNSVLLKLGAKVPELTDQSESNPLVLITSMFSGVAEMLGYYVDNMASEAFISTARRFSSAVKLVKLIDYRIKASSAASADLTMTFLFSGTPTPLTAPYIIPLATVFSTPNGIQFQTVSIITAPVGVTSIAVPVSQRTLQTLITIGSTAGLPDQVVSIGTNYVDSTVFVLIDVTAWTRVETFGFSGTNDEHYIVEISIDKVAYIKFGDGTNGKIPLSGQDINAQWYTTLGVEGNTDANTITNIDTVLINPVGIDELTVTNDLDTVAGTAYESLSTIRRRAPLSLRTLDRAVTKQDYEDVAELATGVDSACVFWECGKTICIYIAPEGGGIAQQILLDSSLDFINERKMVTTTVFTKPAGITPVCLKMEVWARFGIDGSLTLADIEAAILAEWDFESSYINRALHVSDIIAIVDNLEKVDYLNLEEVRTRPYARPINHLIALDYTIKEVGGNLVHDWLIQYVFATDNYRIYQDNALIATIAEGVTTIVDGIVEITINDGPYVNGYEWEFKTYPIDTNIEFDDFSVPIINLADLDITVNEQLVV